MPTTLYRAYDQNDDLLYVGISNNFLSRLNDHQRSSGWHYKAANITLQHYDDRHSAEVAEIEAIQKEFPLWNKKDNLGWQNPSLHFKNLHIYQDQHHIKLVQAQDAILKAIEPFALEVSSLTKYFYSFQSAMTVLYPNDEELDFPCVSCEKVYSLDLIQDHSTEIAVADAIGARAGLWGWNEIWEATVQAVLDVNLIIADEYVA